MRKSRSRISIPLLLIATLHFIVYFSAATQLNTQTFFLRESANTKNLSIQDLNQYQYNQNHFAKLHLHSLLFALSAARGAQPLDAGFGPDSRLSSSALRTALTRSRLSQAHFLSAGLASGIASSSDSDSDSDSAAPNNANPVVAAAA